MVCRVLNLVVLCCSMPLAIAMSLKQVDDGMFPHFTPASEKPAGQYKIPLQFVATVKSRLNLHQGITTNFLKWQMTNPWFDLLLFNDTEVDDFIFQNLAPENLRAYRKISIGAIKADFFRLAFIAVKGGVYMDLDTEFVSRFSPLPIAPDHDYVTELERGCNCLPQWFIAAAPGHPFVTTALARATDNILSGHEDQGKEGHKAGWAGPVVLEIAAKGAAGIEAWPALPNTYDIPGTNRTYTLLKDIMVIHANKYKTAQAQSGMTNWHYDHAPIRKAKGSEVPAG